MNTTPEVSRYAEALPIAWIRESESNPRKTYDQKSLQELAESIKANPLGVVEPLVVQELGPESYCLIAGSRRLRAAKMAGLETIPARIAVLSEKQILEIQLIENLQREDVKPVEEAEGYARLMELDPDYTAEKLAERVGKDRSYVYKRLTLIRLPAPVKDALADSRITIGHALAIARLGSGIDQLRAFGACFSEQRWDGKTKLWIHVTDGIADVSVEHVERFIREEILLDLKSAPWKKDDASLLPRAGACTECPKRTGSNAALFDDLQKGDFCTDSECFRAKRAALITRIVEAGRAEGKVVVEVTVGYGLAEKGSIGRDDFREITKKDRCEHVEPAVVVKGEGRVGQRLEICRTKTCKKHWRQSGPMSSGGSRSAVAKPSEAELLKRKRELLNQRIEVETRREAIRTIADARSEKTLLMVIFIGERLIERLHHDDQKELCAAFGIEPKKKQYGTDYKAPLKGWLKGKKPDAVLPFFVAVASYASFGDSSQQMNAAAELMGVDLADLKKKIAAPLLAKFEAAKQKKAKSSPPETKKAGKKAGK